MNNIRVWFVPYLEEADFSYPILSVPRFSEKRPYLPLGAFLCFFFLAFYLALILVFILAFCLALILAFLLALFLAGIFIITAFSLFALGNFLVSVLS
jgi:hypothetical protein